MELLDIGASDDEPFVDEPLFIESFGAFLCFIDLVPAPDFMLLSPDIAPFDMLPLVIVPLVLDASLVCMLPCCMLLSCDDVGGGVAVGVVDCCAKAPVDKQRRSEKPIGLIARMGLPSMVKRLGVDDALARPHHRFVVHYATAGMNRV